MRQDGTTREYRVLSRHRGGDPGYQSTTTDFELAVKYAAGLESMDSIEEVRVEVREVSPWGPIPEEDLPLAEIDVRVDPDTSRISSW